MILIEASGSWQIDTESGIDCSLGVDVTSARPGPSCFGLPAPRVEALYATTSGASVNCDLVQLCCHSAGTHTEGIGHGSKGRVPITHSLPIAMQMALLISVRPVAIETTTETHPAAAPGDLVITGAALRAAAQPFLGSGFTALCVRTLPNSTAKRSSDYTGRNPTYFTCQAADLVAAYWSVRHLVCDLPSVDREQSGGALPVHQRLWAGTTANTITELAWFPDAAADGQYVLDLQTADLDSDAVMSRPVLFATRPCGPGAAAPSPGVPSVSGERNLD